MFIAFDANNMAMWISGTISAEALVHFSHAKSKELTDQQDMFFVQNQWQPNSLTYMLHHSLFY